MIERHNDSPFNGGREFAAGTVYCGTQGSTIYLC